MKRYIFIGMVLALSLVLVAGACAPKPTEKAASVEDFYKNNVVTLIVNGGVGGGTDYGGRAFASYWPEVTGGAMVVTVKAGGGGIEGQDFVYNAKPDGLTMGIGSYGGDIASPKLLGTLGITWDARTLGWIGWFGSGPQGFFLRIDAPWKTVEDLQREPKLNIGAPDPGSVSSIASVISVEVLGLKNAKISFGYENPELALAAKRGEIDAYGGAASSGVADAAKGLIKPFCMVTREKSAWFPQTPAIAELVKLTPDQDNMITFISALGGGKSFYFPPGVPADKLNYVRRSFDKIMTNEGFLKMAKVRFPVWEKPSTGEQVAAETDKVLNMPPEKVEAMRNLMKQYIK